VTRAGVSSAATCLTVVCALALIFLVIVGAIWRDDGPAQQLIAWAMASVSVVGLASLVVSVLT